MKVERRKSSRPPWQNAKGESTVHLARRPSWVLHGKLLSRKSQVLELTNIVSSPQNRLPGMRTWISKEIRLVGQILRVIDGFERRRVLA